MPPKKAAAAPASKPKAATGTKAPAAKPKAGTAPKATAKPAEKKEVEKPKPIEYLEVPFKQIDAKIVYDKEELVKNSGKWACVVDERSLIGRFLRHRDVNMLTTADESEMAIERIRNALLGAIKFGKPFVIDMMETEMFDFLMDKFNEILPGLLGMVLDKSIIENENYMKIVKESDGQEYQSRYDYNISGFSFVIITSYTTPNENMLRQMFPVKVVD